MTQTPTPNSSDTNTEPLEEINSTGTGSGLEAERTSDDDIVISKPFDPEAIDVITQSRTVDLMLTRLIEGEMNLSPDFQRRSNLWGETTKSALIESMLLKIPIPSLYIAEDNDGNYTVVDGLQRMCAIAHFVNVAALNRAVDKKLSPLRLKKMASLEEYEDFSFDDLPRMLKRRINETELTLHIIRASTPAAVKFNIFARINRGGLPLTAQEIRNAVYRGEWRRHTHAMAESNIFKRATEGRIRGERMEDLELILRFAALYSLPKGTARPPDQTLDDFLNDFVEKKCQQWDSLKWAKVVDAFERAMLNATKIFGRIAFRKYSGPGDSRRPINRGLFETESVAIARCTPQELEALALKSHTVVDKFGQYFNNDKNFQGALLYATGKGWASNKRVEIFDKIFSEVLND